MTPRPSEPAVESAWPKYPGYRVDAVPIEGVGRVFVGDVLVAESRSCVLVRESDHRDQLYLPMDDVTVPLLASDTVTTCPFKGLASHWSVEVGGERVDDVAWSYPEPMDEVASLAPLVAFYAHRVDVRFAAVAPDGDELATTFPVWGLASDLARLMDVEPVGEDVRSFIAPTYPDPPLGTFFDWAPKLRVRNVVEGGQLLGAAVVAASKSCPELPVTFASMLFSKAAHWDSPITFDVDPKRVGRTIASLGVDVHQDGGLRATASVLADVGSDDVIRHAAPMPDVPGPDDCPTHDFGVIGRAYRVVDGAYEHQDRIGPSELHVWARLADDPGPQHLHRAWLAQSVTHWTIGASLRPHDGFTEDDAHLTVSMGPTAATITFHDDADVTQWHLTETTSVYAGRGMVQSQGRTWSADGRLLATTTVQAIVRPFARPIEDMGQDSTTAM